MQSLADDLSLSESDFVHSVRFAFISSIAEVINHKNSNAWQSEKRLSRPLLDQMGWNHG